jgi:hypothetical protein
LDISHIVHKLDELDKLKIVLLNEEQIAQISNLSGGLVCEQSGVVPVSMTQLNTEVLKNNLL